MATKRWLITLDGRPHEVVLEHGYFSARRRITVDGRSEKTGAEVSRGDTRLYIAGSVGMGICFSILVFVRTR